MDLSLELITCELESVLQIGQANIVHILELLNPHSNCVRHQHCFMYLKMMGQEHFGLSAQYLQDNHQNQSRRCQFHHCIFQ